MHVAGWGSHSNRERLILQLANTHCFTREHFQCDYAKFTCGCKTKLKISTRISFNIQYQRIPYCVHGFAFLFIGLKKSHTHMQMFKTNMSCIFTVCSSLCIHKRIHHCVPNWCIHSVCQWSHYWHWNRRAMHIYLIITTRGRHTMKIACPNILRYIDIWSDCIGYMDIWQMHLSDCKWGYMIYKKI